MNSGHSGPASRALVLTFSQKLQCGRPEREYDTAAVARTRLEVAEREKSTAAAAESDFTIRGGLVVHLGLHVSHMESMSQAW